MCDERYYVHTVSRTYRVDAVPFHWYFHRAELRSASLHIPYPPAAAFNGVESWPAVQEPALGHREGVALQRNCELRNTFPCVPRP